MLEKSHAFDAYFWALFHAAEIYLVSIDRVCAEVPVSFSSSMAFPAFGPAVSSHAVPINSFGIGATVLASLYNYTASPIVLSAVLRLRDSGEIFDSCHEQLACTSFFN